MRPGSIVALAVLVGWLALAALAAQPAPRHGRTTDAHASPRTSTTAPAGVAPSSPRTPSGEALRALRDGGLLDLNAATVADLELLPGVGPRLAERIAQARSARGGRFASVAELRAVSGIGPTKLARIARVACAGEGCAEAQRSSASTSESVLTR